MITNNGYSVKRSDYNTLKSIMLVLKILIVFTLFVFYGEKSYAYTEIGNTLQTLHPIRAIYRTLENKFIFTYFVNKQLARRKR